MAMAVNRRRVLMGIAGVMGGALSPVAAKALNAAAAFDATAGYQSLSDAEAATLRAVVDTIMPATDTPGATGAGVDYFIDHLMTAVLNQAEAAPISAFLADFAAANPGFHQLPADKQLRILSEVDAALEDDDAGNYRLVKELTLVGYYTSEAGAAEELAYDPLPGPFQNVSIADYDRTWST